MTARRQIRHRRHFHPSARNQKRGKKTTTTTTTMSWKEKSRTRQWRLKMQERERGSWEAETPRERRCLADLPSFSLLVKPKIRRQVGDFVAVAPSLSRIFFLIFIFNYFVKWWTAAVQYYPTPPPVFWNDKNAIDFCRHVREHAVVLYSICVLY